MQLALHDRLQDRFLALGLIHIAHRAGPHPRNRATQVRVGAAATEHGDHLYRLNAPTAAGGSVLLLRPRSPVLL